MLYLTVLFSFLFLCCWVKVLIVDRSHLQLHSFDLQETLPLRGMLAIGVFLTHICPHLDEASPWLKDFGMWGPPSVACFFLLAGYGLAYSVKTKGLSYLDGFFHKRLSKLLWPFLIMILIYQGYKFSIGTFSWRSLLANPSPLSWFIYALIIWYVGFYLCFKKSRSHKTSIVKIWMFTIVYIAMAIKLHLGLYWISILPLPMAITYVFYEERTMEFIRQHPFITLMLVFLMFIGVMGYTLFAIYIHHLPGWGPIVYNTLPIWVVFLIYVLGGVKNRVTNFLGRISYEIYIVHGFIVMMLADVVFASNATLNSIVILLLTFAITIVCAWIMNNVCKKRTLVRI